MSSGETVARSAPTPSPGMALSSELGLCVAPPLALAAGGVEPNPDDDGDEELEKAAFPETASPAKADDELVVAKFGGEGAHGAWGAGDATQAEVAVVVETLVDVASAAPGRLCPLVGAAWIAPPDWGRNETTPTSKSARASPPTAPAKKPPLLMLSSRLRHPRGYLIPTSRTASSSTA
jgi:hypothetical protein